MNKNIKYSLMAAFPVIAGAVVYKNYPKLNIITGFAAKNVCSCTFEAGRELQSILKGDNKDLVVVRFGLTDDPEFDVDTFLGGILGAFG